VLGFAAVSALDLDDLVARFIACRLPRPEWTHLAHLRVGAWHVQHEGPDAAVASLRARIRALNDHHGTPNSATSGYHETITVAYVRLLAEFLGGFADATPLATRVDVLVSGRLSEKELLLAFWSRERLFSEGARRLWVPPDRAPLRLPEEARAR
jgi:hypothetical protein